MRKDNHYVMLSLASNTEQEHHLQIAREALKELMTEIRFTPTQWTEPFSTNNKRMYLNQLAIGKTYLPLDDFNSSLKEIEQTLGRERDKRNIVTIDIDILSYDDTRHHQKDWDRPYIKELLKKL